MKSKINPLITLLYSGKISKEEFLREYFRGIAPSNKYVMKLIEKGVESKDTVPIEEAIVLMYTGRFSNACFVGELCELLQMPWHTKHEDIAMLLKDLADPATVDCLYKAAELRLDYLNYDDTYQFARKCIKAIASIGNDEAIDKLKLLAGSKIKEISEYAKKELVYKGALS